MASPQQHTERLIRLEHEIRRMKVEFEQFMNGAPGVDLPSVERRRMRIGQELRRLRNEELKGVEESFRLANLESKYNSYCELFGRRVRRLEEGEVDRAGGGSRKSTDPERGLVVEGRVGDDAVEALYQGLHQRAGNRPRFDVNSFRTYLERQLDTIRSKTGCERVMFRIAEEGGKMKLKARPVRE